MDEEKINSSSLPRQQDVYFSIDVETDGPIPGPYSMLSFAIVEAGVHDGNEYLAAESPRDKYWELKPISPRFEPDAVRVNGLDRSRLERHGLDPAVAMREAAEWIESLAGGRRPVMVASPAGFDWMFMHWYFTNFLGNSPFGHSGVFDIKTALSIKFGRPIAQSGRANLPAWLSPRGVGHTHHALDDAREQASIFSTVVQWRGLLRN